MLLWYARAFWQGGLLYWPGAEVLLLVDTRVLSFLVQQVVSPRHIAVSTETFGGA